jgi:hypothetical protein
MSMSLDGYVADGSDGVAEVFDWYFNSGNVKVKTGGGDPMTFKVSEPSAGTFGNAHRNSVRFLQGGAPSRLSRGGAVSTRGGRLSY